MPEIPAQPGEWLELAVLMLRLCLDPSSLEATQDIDAAWNAYMLHAVLRHFKGESFTLTQSDLEKLAAGNADRVPLGIKVQELAYGLLTAGHVLTYALRMKRHLPRLASAESAFKIVAMVYVREKWPASATYIKAAWRRYRPVAHYVAAANQSVDDLAKLRGIFPDFAELPSSDSSEINLGREWLGKWKADQENIAARAPIAGAVFPKFFAYSEALRRQGESHFAPNQERRGRPLLDAATTWYVPAGFTLPTVNLSLPDLDAAEREAAAGVN